jgi:hypothetical protein
VGNFTPEQLGAWLVGLFALVAGAYKGFLNLRKDTSGNNHAITVDAANEALIKHLQAERDMHKADADELRAQTQKISEQNKMLKMWLRLNFGVTDDDFIKIGVEP